MANPLALAAPQQRGTTDLREWCAQRNEWASRIGFDRWYFVATDQQTGTTRIESKDGQIAADVLKVLAGWFPDYDGWSADKLNKEFGLLKYFARNGMTEDDWARVKLAPH